MKKTLLPQVSTAEAPPDAVSHPDTSTKAMTFGVQGMTCASCVGQVEKALKQVPGVETAVVNLATEKATIRFDPQQTDVDALVEAVQDSGYTPVIAETSLAVGGMTCASCVGHVERGLQKLEGALEAHVNLATERARVRYIPDTVSLGQLKDAVRETGYPDGRGRSGLPTADPNAGGPGRELLCASGRDHCRDDLRRLVVLRPRARPDFRSGQCGGDADHRLSVRHEIGHPDGDYGRNWQSRRNRGALPQRRGPAEPAGYPRHRPGQDRHAHEGSTRGDRLRGATQDPQQIEQARLEILDFIFSSPAVPPDEEQIAPTFVRMAWEAQQAFHWAHTLHRSLYDLFASDQVQDKEDAYQRIIADYLEKPEAVTSHRLDHHGKLWSFPESKSFRDQYPKFNTQIWGYHWLQAVVYDVQLLVNAS